jgi:putative transposase
MTTRQRYESDLTDEQWALVRPLLPKRKTPVGAPITVSRRDLLDALFYLLRTGCQWRQLPHDFPPWGTIASQYHRWRVTGVWERIHHALHARTREHEGKGPRPTGAVLDSQSVKTAEGGDERGYDAAKHVSGRKRHLLVDTLGLLISVVVHGANVQDEDGAVGVLAKAKARFPRLKRIWADRRYACKHLPVRVAALFLWALEIVSRPLHAVGFVVLPKRWVVERTFAWLVRFRRLGRDYERCTKSSETMIHLAIIRLMLRRLCPA